jgi:hypothetical protein
MAIVIGDKTTKLDFGNRLLPAIQSSEIGATDYCSKERQHRRSPAALG